MERLERMNLYRHYKNKFYRYRGTVKHSETQEDLVLYDCLYDSPGGKTWVRPQNMFHEVIEHDGRMRPRFEPAAPEIRATTEVTQEDLLAIGIVMKDAFGEWDPKWFHSTFDHQKNVHLLIARIDGKPAGFKLGYARSASDFYSWLGGVVPEYRGFGIASTLMRKQHAWAKTQGFETVSTNTRNRFRDMLLLNIRCGFNVVGVKNSGSEIAIQLEKKLE